MITVTEIMTPNPVTLSAEASLRDALDLMQEKRIRHIPIIDAQERLVGLVTQRDLLAARESNLTRMPAEQMLAQETQRLVSDFMSTEVTSVSPRAGVKEAARYILQRKYGCLPVIDQNQLVGIVTDHDFVAVAVNLLELQELQEPQELQ